MPTDESGCRHGPLRVPGRGARPGAAGAALGDRSLWRVHRGRGGGQGTRTLPPAGPPIVTSSPIFPSRAVPSWFFGDGASLLNAVNAEFDLAAQVTPLDPAFAPLDVAARGELRRAPSPPPRATLGPGDRVRYHGERGD